MALYDTVLLLPWITIPNTHYASKQSYFNNCTNHTHDVPLYVPIIIALQVITGTQGNKQRGEDVSKLLTPAWKTWKSHYEFERERISHLNGAQIEWEARVAIPSLRADAREPLPDPRRGHAHDLRWGRTNKEGEGKRPSACEPMHRDKQRNQATGGPCVPGEEWEWRWWTMPAPERRRTARKEPALWSMPNERARALLSSSTSPSSPVLSPFSTYAPRSARETMDGWGGGRPRRSNPGVREIPRTDQPRGLSPAPRRAGGAPLFSWFVWLATWRFSFGLAPLGWWRELLRWPSLFLDAKGV